MLWLELRIKAIGIHKKNISICKKTQLELKEHRKEKTLVWKKQKNLLTLTVISTFAIVGATKLACTPWNLYLWRFGPSVSDVGLAFAYPILLNTMDSCLDECHPYQPRFTILASILMQLGIIVKLTTASCGGHIILLWKAMELLLATCIGHTIDNLAWSILALFCCVIFGWNTILGRFPSVPNGIPTMGWISFLTLTVSMSTLYQMAQNVSTFRVKKILEVRAIGRVVALVLGTPPSWLLFDVWYNQINISWKIIVDSVALRAIGEEGELKKRG